MWRVMTSTTLRGVDIQALCVTSRSDYLRNWFSFSHSHVRSIAHTASAIPAPIRNKGPFSEKTEAFFSLSRPYTRPPHSLFPEKNAQKLRTQRFEQTLELLSTHASQAQSKRPSPQVRSSAWLYLFDLATCPEQLERASTQFSQFVESGRRFRVEHSTAFVRRCVELRCSELALTVFKNRPVYRMDLTLPAARQLLYTLHEGHQLSDVVLLAALFPLYNLPALSSDPISCALLTSACLREVNISDSEPAQVIAATLLSPFKQLLSQTPPMPVSAGGNRFLESHWMKDAMLSILDSLVVQGYEASWVRDWCRRSGYNLSSNVG
ncbi:hypothetical protein V8E52_008298 [Russula decolorans]